MLHILFLTYCHHIAALYSPPIFFISSESINVFPCLFIMMHFWFIPFSLYNVLLILAFISYTLHFKEENNELWGFYVISLRRNSISSEPIIEERRLGQALGGGQKLVCHLVLKIATHVA